MKRIFLLLLLFGVTTSFMELAAQTRAERKALFGSSYNYEVVPIGVGQDGTKALKIWGVGKNVEAAIVQAKKNAIAACIFRGIPGGNGAAETPALCPAGNCEDTNADYFDKFFVTASTYLKFINLTTDGVPSGQDRLKIKGGYKVAIYVQVMYDNLRKQLETDGIIAKLGESMQQINIPKPIIMVVPSDAYCIAKGYTTRFDGQTIPDYKKALQTDRDLRLVITKMGGLMVDRGFPMKDLEQELKNLDTESAELSLISSKESGSAVMESPIDQLLRTAKADIILDLDFSVNKRGSEQYITFNLRGLDAYTAKQISGAAGDGRPSTAATPGLLLEEAVLSHMDDFNGRLTTFFEDLYANGREIKVAVRRWENAPVDFTEAFDYSGETLELTDIIDNWMYDNTVKHQYSRTGNTDNLIRFEQVRIPIVNKDSRGRERAVDSRSFIQELNRTLAKEPFNLPSKIYQKGLGEVWLIVGEK
jgi:hypothetical protein